jgi:hypothetical protein
MSGAILPLPNASSWRGAQLKHRDNFNFTFIDNEINSNNKHSLRSNTKVMAAKPTRLTHKIAIQLYLVAESCTICSSH